MNLVVIAYLDINLGDDLFVKTIANRYKDHNLYLVTKDSKYLLPFNKYKNVFGVTYKEVLVNTKKYDSCIIIGGSIFQDYGDKRDYLNYIRRNLVIKSFKLRNKPVFIMGSNIGPMNTKLGSNIFKSTFNNSTFISVRDTDSYNILKDLNIKSKYGVYPDIVFSLNDTIKDKINTNKILGISVINYGREKEYKSRYVKKITKIIDEYIGDDDNDNKKVYLFGFDAGKEDDEIVIDEILSKIKFKNNVDKIIYKGDMDWFLNKFRQATFIIGSRFHSIILALKYNIPFFPIIYSQKTKNLLDDIKYNLDYIEYKNIEILNEKSLIKNIYSNSFDYEISDEYIEKSKGHFEKLDEFINS